MSHAKCNPETLEAASKPRRGSDRVGPCAQLENSLLWSPAVDVLESEGSFLLRADLPGVSQEGLTLRLEERELILEGSRAAPWVGRGWEKASFRRRFSLPQDAELGSIEAKLDAGVLQIQIPRRAEPKAREIAVQVV